MRCFQSLHFNLKFISIFHFLTLNSIPLNTVNILCIFIDHTETNLAKCKHGSLVFSFLSLRLFINLTGSAALVYELPFRYEFSYAA